MNCAPISTSAPERVSTSGPSHSKNKTPSFLSLRLQSAHIRQVVDDSASVLALPDTVRLAGFPRGYDRRKVQAMNDAAGKSFIDLTASIVSAYLSNNPTPASEIPALISQIHAALMRVSTGRIETPLEPAKPAVSVKKSMTPDYLVCLEDGKRFKSLKRHLRTQYNMTPEQYRDKWSLPADYPMVAPNYAVARSQLAKKMGLGQQRRRRK
jgi:predicted transcriptional regulator